MYSRRVPVRAEQSPCAGADLAHRTDLGLGGEEPEVLQVLPRRQGHMSGLQSVRSQIG